MLLVYIHFEKQKVSNCYMLGNVQSQNRCQNIYTGLKFLGSMEATPQTYSPCGPGAFQFGNKRIAQLTSTLSIVLLLLLL